MRRQPRIAAAALLVLLCSLEQRAGAQPPASKPQESPMAATSGPLESLLGELLLSSLKHSLKPSPAPAKPSRPAQQNASLALVRSRWRLMELSLDESVGALADELARQLGQVRARADVHLSADCGRALDALPAALGQQQPAAMQMLDASARLPAGLLQGTLTELGNFDQCLGVGPAAQYCSLLVKPALVARPRLHTICVANPSLSSSKAKPLVQHLARHSHHFFYAGLRLGICLPASCSQPEVQQLLAGYLAKYQLLGQVKSCQRPNPASSNGNHSSSWWKPPTETDLGLDSTQTCVACLFLILLVLVISGSMLDLFKKNRLESSSANKPSGSQQQLACQSSNNKRQADGRCCLISQPRSRVRLAATRGQPKCWLYQVHPGAGKHETSSAKTSLSDISTLGAQENPLLLLPSSKHLLCSRDALATKLTPPPAGHQHEGALHGGNHIDDDQETWISRLERNEHSGQSSLETTSSPSEGFTLNKSVRPTISVLIAFLTCFSLRRSLSSLGKLKQPARDGDQPDGLQDIKVIHGLRTLTMVWIIFGHSIGLVSPEMLNNLFSLAHLSCKSRLLQAALNATLAVNTFFFISGLVTSISFSRKCKINKPAKVNKPSQAEKLDQNVLDDRSSIVSNSDCPSAASRRECIRKQPKAAPRASRPTTGDPEGAPTTAPPSTHFRPLYWLLMRYLRLTPAYLATVGAAIILPALGSGPFWPESAGSVDLACRKNWLFNLSYTNNFVHTDKLCLIHSWYLSNDMQFFVLALILFGLYRKSAHLAGLAAILVALGSTVMTFIQTLLNEFPPTIVTTSPAVAERWLYIHSLYYKPWPHLPSYLLGLMLGPFILANETGRLSKLSRFWRRLGWLAFFMVSLSVLNSIYPWNMGLKVDPYLTALHAATFRTLWAACVAWLLFSLITRPKSVLTRLLSWPGFQLASRLAYCAYLVHPLLIYYHFGTLRERMDSSAYGQLQRFLATLLLSYLSALLLSVFVESPSIAIQHLLTIRPNDKTSTSASTAFHSGDFGERAMDMSQTEADQDEEQGDKRHRKLSTTETSHSSSASNSSWSANTSSNLTSDSYIRGDAHRPTMVGDSFRLLMSSCSRQSADQLAAAALAAHPCSHWPSESAAQVKSASSLLGEAESHKCDQETGAGAVDSEFQRKLAQAISRGFRIRSRLASSSAQCSSALISGSPMTGAGQQKGSAQIRSAPSSELMRTFVGVRPVGESASCASGSVALEISRGAR